MNWQVELRQTLKLAVPVIITQVGFMTMGLVDTMVSGRISTETLAGLGLASSFFGSITMVLAGTLHALDTFFAQAAGAKKPGLAQAFFEQGLWISIVLTLISLVLILLGAHIYSDFSASKQVAVIFSKYLHISVWSIPCIFSFKVLERYWQSIQVVYPFTLILIVSNLLNLFFDLALGLGWWGFPKLGAEGIAWSTVINRYWGLIAILTFTYWRKDKQIELRFPRWSSFYLKSLLRLGIPTCMQIGLEVGAFISMSFMAGFIGAAELATHQIVLNVASFSFMFALGFHSVATIRVGRWMGAGDREAARMAGWLAIVLSALVMGGFCLAFILIPETILGWFTIDRAVIALGVDVLLVAALFQISDGVQTASTGALRGIGDAISSLKINFIGHYLIGLPLGCLLCFHYGWSVQGLWVGAASGLTFVAITLTLMWKKKIRTAAPLI